MITEHPERRNRVVDKETTKIRRMFAAISPRYDLLNHLLSLNIDKRWRRRTVRELDLPGHAHVLDICTGTADLALELTRAVDTSLGGKVYGTDFTAEMVRIGAAKGRKRGLAQPFLCVADSLSLPFPARRFDAVTVAFGIRNVRDLELCLREMWRVLKPGGQAAILDFSMPRSRLVRSVYQVYFHWLLPRVGAWISGSRAGADAYRYLPDSVSEFLPPERFSEVLREGRFENVRFRRLTCGIAVLHLARRPADQTSDTSSDERSSASEEATPDEGVPVVEENEEVLYALILERSSPRPVHEIGRIVARHLSLAAPDAVAQVRYGGGLVADALSESQVRALSDSLKEIDVSVRAVEAEEWWNVPRGYKISTLLFGDGALEACLSTGRKFVIPTDDIFGVHLYGLSSDDAAPRSAGERDAGRPAPLELSSLSSRGRQLLGNLEEHQMTGMELHLTLYAPPRVGPLRVRRGDFNFACLGDAKRDHSFDNFIVLLEKLVEALPKAWNMESVEDFLSDMDVRRIHYFKKEEASNFDRWMLQWVAIEARERERGMTNDH